MTANTFLIGITQPRGKLKKKKGRVLSSLFSPTKVNTNHEGHDTGIMI